MPTTGEMVVCSSADQRYTAVEVVDAVTTNPLVVSKDLSVFFRPSASSLDEPLMAGS